MDDRWWLRRYQRWRRRIRNWNYVFDVEDRLVDLVNEGVDLDIRIGDDIAPNLIARKLATNYRILCASPEFIAQHGAPKHLTDLSALPCLVIKERDHPFGVWQLRNKEGHHAIKVTGPLSSNHGEIVHQWCLDGQGILCVPGGMLAKTLPVVI
ncbi:LysR substrate-binding domain-containing protein [Escherichia coli]|uniref:LysR substrate-binding domain-containing protein n=1 Tax=Escherichia coli TaxID=562 RepID=UPI0021F4C6DF|nr:LysR substrate-binding domain-containing protein [Escherichia coli]